MRVFFYWPFLHLSNAGCSAGCSQVSLPSTVVYDRYAACSKASPVAGRWRAVHPPRHPEVPSVRDRQTGCAAPPVCCERALGRSS